MTIRPVGMPAAAGHVEPLLDHLVYGTPDLGATIAAFHDRTGLSPAAGGRHLGLGTRNYLVGLGPQRYLEIVGPDPEHPPDPGVAMPFGLAGLTSPRLLAWAVRPLDIRSVATALAAEGVDLGEIRGMQRSRPDGVLLRWRLALPTILPWDGLVPFLIDWGATPHPAGDARPRADLLVVRGHHPRPAALRRVLRAGGVHLPVDLGGPALTAIIDTPEGPVELS